MSWESDWHYLIKKDPQEIFKEHSPLLDSLDKKQKKLIKKTLQSVEPTELFGQDFTQLGELIDALRDIDLIKADDKLKKKVKSFDEKNLDIVATATKLRKQYEILYRQLKGLVYPKRKGDMRDE